MDPEVPTRGNRRGFRRWFWIILAALPFAVPVAGLLWLASPAGCGWVAGKIGTRVRLETRVGGVSVSPWNGITLSRVEVLQPPSLRGTVKAPLAAFHRIRLSPVWRSWLRGRLELQSIELDTPSIVLPLELMAEIARSQKPAALPQTTPVPPQSPQADPNIPPAPPPAVSATPPAPQPKIRPEAPRMQLPPTGWIRLRDASFRLVSAAGGRDAFEIRGISGSVPISGRSAKSSLSMGSLLVAGSPVLAEADVPLDWNMPLLSVAPLTLESHGFKFTLAGKLAMLAGMPVQWEAVLPRQKPAETVLPGNLRADAEAIAANFRFRGLLLSPGTWQADFLSEVLAPSVTHGDMHRKFDKGSAVTVLRGGMLSCVDARLVGDDLSVLGNATLLADGRLAAAVRFVAPPDDLSSIVNRVFPGIHPPPPVVPMSSPQRSSFDLEASGNIRQIFLRLGRDGPILTLQR